MVESLVVNLECSVHLDVLEQPVTLNCGHNFCKVCAESLIQNNVIRCPLCRKQMLLPNGKNSLQINITLDQITKSLSNLNINKSKSDGEKQRMIDYVKETFINKNEKIDIVWVKDISNQQVKHRFNQLQQRMGGNVVQKLHGTYEKFVKKIQEEGFQMPDSFNRKEEDQEGKLTFGKAIYFSSYASKSANYGDGIIIVSDLLLGKVKQYYQSDTTLTHEDAQKQGFNTIFFDSNVYGKQVDLIQGSITDEYALFNSAQVYPRFAIKYKTVDIAGNVSNLSYKGNHNYQNTEFGDLIKLLNGPQSQQLVAFRILGDLSRDFNAKTVQNILHYHQTFFLFANHCLQESNEQLILQVLRVLWNSSFNNKFMQQYVIQHTNFKVIINFLDSYHISIQERAAGVIQNITQLRKENAQILQQAGITQRLIKVIEGSLKVSQIELLRKGLGALGNIVNYCQTADKTNLVKIEELIVPLLDIQDSDIEEQAIRIISNNIGYEYDWIQNQYQPSKGLEKI